MSVNIITHAEIVSSFLDLHRPILDIANTKLIDTSLSSWGLQSELVGIDNKQVYINIYNVRSSSGWIQTEWTLRDNSVFLTYKYIKENIS